MDENEASYEGMTRILEEMQKYVPSMSVPVKRVIPESSLQNEKTFIDTVVGGDLLSSMRARGAMYVRGGSELMEHQLKGFFIMSEDWHALVCYIEVCLIIFKFHRITWVYFPSFCRQFGIFCLKPVQVWKEEHFTSLEI